LLALIGLINQLGLAFVAGLCTAAGLLIYQQVLIHKRARDSCFKAFLNNHYVGLDIFVGLFLSFVFAR